MSNTKLLPYETILAATKGDPLALETVVSSFKGYTNRLATREFQDSSGAFHHMVDDDMKNRLEMKLIVAVMKFNADE